MFNIKNIINKIYDNVKNVKGGKNFKKGKLVEGSAKYWNSKGEPVDSLEEARK